MNRKGDCLRERLKYMRKIENIFVMAPVGHASGGAELSHQLCFVINEISDVNARICYVETAEKDIKKSFPIDEKVISNYEVYRTNHVKNFDEIDREDSLVIVPEGLTLCVEVIQNARIALWWMSVDNYLVSTNEQNISLLKQKVLYHFVQSKYAEEYVKQKFDFPQIYPLSDYINDLHGQFIFPENYRKNQILYNPQKGKECVNKLIEMLPDYDFIPLFGLTTEEMIVLMQYSKLYIDFGNHPGKDRIPREAAANGCCIITNKKGSAKYFEDIPIDDKYKIEDPLSQIDYFKNLVDDIFENYEMHFMAFENYRKWIKEEKERFIIETEKVLNVVSE